MKNLTYIALALMVTLSLTGCATSSDDEPKTSETSLEVITAPEGDSNGSAKDGL